MPRTEKSTVYRGYLQSLHRIEGPLLEELTAADEIELALAVKDALRALCTATARLVVIEEGEDDAHDLS